MARFFSACRRPNEMRADLGIRWYARCGCTSSMVCFISMDSMIAPVAARGRWRRCRRKFWPGFGEPLIELNSPYGSLSLMSGDRRFLAQQIRGDAGTETIEHPGTIQETRAEESLDPPWLVVVHNDPVNLMTYVTMVFQRVIGYPREKAAGHMLEVHQKGRSVLWSGMRERAELYVQQLHGYLLLATLEKAG